MTLKELLDQKRAVQGKRLLTLPPTNICCEHKIIEVSQSKEYVKLLDGGWRSVKDFDERYKIIEILKG